MRDDPPTTGLGLPSETGARHVARLEEQLREATRELANVRRLLSTAQSNQASVRHILAMTRQPRDELRTLLDASEAFPGEKALMHQCVSHISKLIKRAEEAK